MVDFVEKNILLFGFGHSCGREMSCCVKPRFTEVDCSEKNSLLLITMIIIIIIVSVHNNFQ